MLSLQDNYFDYDILLSLHCVDIINEMINLYITYVIIFCFSFGHGSWIYNYLCNQYLSPLPLWVRIPTRRGVLDTAKLVSNLRQVSGFLGDSGFLHQYNCFLPRNNWNIVESGLRHHNSNPSFGHCIVCPFLTCSLLSLFYYLQTFLIIS